MNCTIFIITYFFLFGILSYSQEFNETAKLISTDNQEEEGFGNAVAISGNYAVVGAPNNNDWHGAAFVFHRDTQGNWNFIQKLVSSETTQQGRFGYSVSIDGYYILIGAPEEENQSDIQTGACYIFKLGADDAWQQIKRLLASDGTDEAGFGWSVALSGSTAIIGALNEGYDENGEFYFQEAGAAYIFEGNVYGIWNEQQKLVGTHRGEHESFGWDVDVVGGYAIVGAPYKNLFGMAYIYYKNSFNFWEVSEMTGSEHSYGYGFSVGLSNNYAWIGTNEDSVIIYNKQSDGSWVHQQNLFIPESHDLGIPVDVSEYYGIVGSRGTSKNEEGSSIGGFTGAAYLYTLNGMGIWEQSQMVLASDHFHDDFFGHDVAISNDYAIIGKNLGIYDVAEPPPIGSGSAHIFETCSENPVNNPDNIIENGDFENCMLYPWSTYYHTWEGAIGSTVVIDGNCIITPLAKAALPLSWHIQIQQILSQSQLDQLHVGNTYRLSFDAFAGTNNYNCKVYIGEYGGSNTSILYETTTISTSKQTYSYNFTMSEVFADMKLSFENGNCTGGLTLDNISLVNTTEPDPDPLQISAGEINKTVSVYPNPATDVIHIHANTGFIISMYNISGNLLIEKQVDRNTAIPVHLLPEGLYILKISKGHCVLVERIVVQHADR